MMQNPKKSFLIVLSFAAGVGAGFLLGKKVSDQDVREEMHARWQALKDTVLARMRSARNLTEAKYNSIVDRAVDEYAEARDLAADETERLKRRLRHAWEKMLMLVERAAREARQDMDDENAE